MSKCRYCGEPLRKKGAVWCRPRCHSRWINWQIAMKRVVNVYDILQISRYKSRSIKIDYDYASNERAGEV